MMPSKLDQFAINRVVGGESFLLKGRTGFGPLYASQIRLQGDEARSRLLEFPRIDASQDELIADAFERVREGLSADRFLCDPKLSRALHVECAKRGLDAPEAAINLRLLAVRKNPRRNLHFRETRRPAAARDIVERLGPGVEAAMRFTTARYGASVDDMLAHPGIGREFVRFAAKVSSGGTGVEYRMCALQIRKGRHIAGEYSERVAKLDVEDLEHRWIDARDGAPPKLLAGPGLIEMETRSHPLYLLRTRRIGETLEKTFTPESIDRLIHSDPFARLNGEHVTLRFVGKRDLPSGTPKAWELLLIRERQYRFNWPVTVDEAA
jgi:hypothetical protein